MATQLDSSDRYLLEHWRAFHQMKDAEAKIQSYVAAVAGRVLRAVADKHKTALAADDHMQRGYFFQLVPQALGKTKDREYLALGIEHMSVSNLLDIHGDQPLQAYVYSKYADQSGPTAVKWLQRVAAIVETPKGFESFREKAGYLFRMVLPPISAREIATPTRLGAFLSEPLERLAEWWIANRKTVPKAPE